MLPGSGVSVELFSLPPEIGAKRCKEKFLPGVLGVSPSSLLFPQDGTSASGGMGVRGLKSNLETAPAGFVSLYPAYRSWIPAEAGMTEEVQRNAAGSLRVSLRYSLFLVPQDWGIQGAESESNAKGSG